MAAGHTQATQAAIRRAYATIYRPADAPVRRPVVPLNDAYDPLGLRIAGFVVKPSLEITRAYDTNPSRVPNGVRSAYTMVSPELQAKSEWAQHELGATLRGSYSSYDSLHSSDRPSADAKVFGRIDVTRDFRFDLEGRFLLGTDYPGSPNIQADLAKLPISTTLGGTLGFAQRFGRFELAAKGLVDRTVYQASKFTDGSTFSNHDRDFNQYGGQVRASYELTPGVKPFVELGTDRRIHDLGSDRSGVQRDSNALMPKAGTTFELSRLITGELSVGYLLRHYKDAGLQELRGVTADASLIWVMTGLTTATVTATTRADESTVAGVSGAFRRDGGLQIEHAFRRWLIGTVKVGVGFDQYVGSTRADARGSLSAALTYKLNREVALKGEVRQDWMRSNAANVDYNATTYLFGLKLQR